MSRVILPPFQHKYGSTELSHALDAERLDAAFTEVANALNGGIDETNLSSGLLFSTGTPGGASVSTAIGAKYALVTLTASPLGRTNARVPVGVVGTGWVPYSWAISGYNPSFYLATSDLSVDAGAAGTGTSLYVAASPSAMSNYVIDDSGNFSAHGTLTAASLTSGWVVTAMITSTTIKFRSVALTFKVPVL